MRRAIGPLWPVLSATFGIHPWDIDRLTAAELNDYLAQAQLHLTPPAAPSEPTAPATHSDVVTLPI